MKKNLTLLVLLIVATVYNLSADNAEYLKEISFLDSIRLEEVKNADDKVDPTYLQPNITLNKYEIKLPHVSADNIYEDLNDSLMMMSIMLSQYAEDSNLSDTEIKTMATYGYQISLKESKPKTGKPLKAIDLIQGHEGDVYEMSLKVAFNREQTLSKLLADASNALKF